MKILLIFLVAFASKNSFAASNIINGELATAQAMDAVVALVDLHKNSYFCSGTLIHPYLVLTATHCVNKMRAEKISIHVGNGKINHLNLYPVSTVFSYLKTDSDFYLRTENNEKIMNDIAIMVLKQPIMNVEPVRLIKSNRELMSLSPKESMVVIGFGQDENGIGGIKRFGLAKLNSVDPKANRVNIDFSIDTNTFSTAYFGDSGGPLLSHGKSGTYQVGVTSRIQYETPKTRGVVKYTLAHKYLCWIESKTKINLEHSFDCSDSSQQMDVNVNGLEIRL